MADDARLTTPRGLIGAVAGGLRGSAQRLQAGDALVDLRQVLVKEAGDQPARLFPLALQVRDALVFRRLADWISAIFVPVFILTGDNTAARRDHRAPRPLRGP